MPAIIRKLNPRPERLKQEQGQELRQLVMALEGLPADAVGKIVSAIDQQTASNKGWTFVMLSPQQNAAVVGWLATNSCRKGIAPVIWAQLLTALRIDTGEVLLTRDELAEKAGTRTNVITDVLRELEQIGAVSRRLETVPGRRGRQLRIYVSPRVATHLTGRAREMAQQAVDPVG